MAYILKYSLDVCWIGDGANQMSVPSAQRKKFVNSITVLVPGGDSPTAANFNTAIGASSPSSGTMAYDLEAQVLANLTQLQGFSTGGG
jgi:hypothetical protein